MRHLFDDLMVYLWVANKLVCLLLAIVAKIKNRR